MNFFVLILLVISFNPLNAMEPVEKEKVKDKKHLKLTSHEFEIYDAQDRKDYLVQLVCDNQNNSIIIANSDKHWFYGWRTKRNTIPLVCLINDQLINIRTEGLCYLGGETAKKNVTILCPIIASFLKKEESPVKKYDACIVGKYGLYDQNYHFKMHVTSGKITRMKFKVSSDNQLNVISYSRYDDTIAKSRQVLDINTLAEVQPTAIVTQWKKTQLP